MICYLTTNPVDPHSWKKLEGVSLLDMLSDELEAWPETARLYAGAVSRDRDVTPHDEASANALEEMEGPFYAVVYPADPVTAIIAVAAVVLGVAAALLLTPVPQIPKADKVNSGSPNNELGQRTNEARPRERIPDIFGTVRATPDLIAVPFRKYAGNLEYEVSYLCVGRGSYDISGIRDSGTDFEDMFGAQLAVYGPNTSPNSGSPQLQIGEDIEDALLAVRRCNEVNGQQMRHLETGRSVTGSNDIRFRSAPYRIESLSGSEDFTADFAAGDLITLSGSVSGANTVNVDGTGYRVLQVDANEIWLQNPEAINANWASITGSTSSVTITYTTQKVGPFDVILAGATTLFCNFVAPRGLFKGGSSDQEAISVGITIRWQPLSVDGTAADGWTSTSFTMTGSDLNADQIAHTEEIDMGEVYGGVRVEAWINTARNGTSKPLADEVRWQDAYAAFTLTQDDFGDVTTIHAVTYATTGALQPKERKLNCIAQRKVATRLSSMTEDFTTALTATNRADHIISALARDVYIGDLADTEVDYDSIYDTVAAVEAYFGDALAVEFNGTFDDINESFEEAVKKVAAAIFCSPYIEGGELKLQSELPGDVATIIFNHRNKRPGSEVRNYRFGYENDHDGIELTYVDPTSDIEQTIQFPVDGTAVKPKKIESFGLRNRFQAFMLAMRAWQKVKYSNVFVSFDGLAESGLLVHNTRMLVADNTRQDTQDGEVVGQSGLTLTLSQNVTLASSTSYVIHLQHVDGTTESISISAGAASNQVVLAGAPAASINYSADDYARTTYVIVEADDPRELMFLVDQADPQDGFVWSVTGVNYDKRYYDWDSLVIWLTFENLTAKNYGGYDIVPLANTASPFVSDATRGNVFQATATSHRINLPDFVTYSAYTKMMWVYINAFGTASHIFSSAGGGVTHEAFLIDAAGNLEAGHSGTFDSVSAAWPAAAAWHHAAVTYDGATMKLYINGVEVDSATVAQRTLAGVHVNGYQNGNSMVGKLDDVRLYSKALTAAEILAIKTETEL